MLPRRARLGAIFGARATRAAARVSGLPRGALMRAGRAVGSSARAQQGSSVESRCSGVALLEARAPRRPSRPAFASDAAAFALASLLRRARAARLRCAHARLRASARGAGARRGDDGGTCAHKGEGCVARVHTGGARPIARASPRSEPPAARPPASSPDGRLNARPPLDGSTIRRDAAALAAADRDASASEDVGGGGVGTCREARPC
jgi:hypothetical protein